MTDQQDYIMRSTVREEVTELINADPCGTCLSGKAAGLEQFLSNISVFTASEKKLCIMTALSILEQAESAQSSRARSTGERIRFKYYIPLIGCVCKPVFLTLFNVSAPTIARYKKKIRRGWLVE
jgi:hypothetical protein